MRTLRTIALFGILIHTALFVPKFGFSANSIPPYKIYTMSGKAVESSEFSNRPYLLHFWASWCWQCVPELDELAELQKNVGDDLLILAVHEGNDADDVRRVQKIMKGKKLNYDIYMDGGGISRLFAVEAVPTTILVDRKGSITGRLLGVQDWKNDQNLGLIEGLIGRKER